jgi:hypothetical protein
MSHGGSKGLMHCLFMSLAQHVEGGDLATLAVAPVAEVAPFLHQHAPFIGHCVAQAGYGPGFAANRMGDISPLGTWKGNVLSIATAMEALRSI